MIFFSNCLCISDCLRKKKLIGEWQKTTQTGDSGASLIAFNSLQAFKFPDKVQVFLTCNIEVSVMDLSAAPIMSVRQTWGEIINLFLSSKT